MNESTRKLPFDFAETMAMPVGLMAAGVPMMMKVVKDRRSENAETHTKLYANGGVIKAELYKDGNLNKCRCIMPDVVDVKVIEKDNQPKVVIVSFADESKEKAVLANDDTYSLEQGISICLMKKLLGEGTDSGSALYNKLIKHTIDVMKAKEKAAEDAKKAAETEKRKAEKQAQKQKKRREKFEAEAREYEISIHVEAYKRAISQIMEEGKAELEESVTNLAELIEQIASECEDEENSNNAADKEPTVSEMNNSQA